MKSWKTTKGNTPSVHSGEKVPIKIFQKLRKNGQTTVLIYEKPFRSYWHLSNWVSNKSFLTFKLVSGIKKWSLYYIQAKTNQTMKFIYYRILPLIWSTSQANHRGSFLICMSCNPTLNWILSFWSLQFHRYLDFNFKFTVNLICMSCNLTCLNLAFP